MRKNRSGNGNKIIIRNNIARMIGLCACLILCETVIMGCGVQDEVILITSSKTAETESLSEPEETAGGREEALAEMSQPDKTICVYVCGAVMQPGVVELPEESRAGEALAAAGGFAPEAQTDYVNLAAKLMDGEKLYFPEVGEAQSLQQQAEADALGLVNINTAGEEQLCTLPGIGASRAQDIIRYREQKGKFTCPEDIMKVSGIKENAYEKLKDRIIAE